MIAAQRQRQQLALDELAVDAARAARAAAPTPRIAAWGGLITGVIAVIPYMPRFETVNVAPDSSGGVIVPSRTRSASRRDSAAISASERCVGVEDGRARSARRRRPRRRRR